MWGNFEDFEVLREQLQNRNNVTSVDLDYDSDDIEPDTDDMLDENHLRSFHAVLLISCVFSIIVGVIMPFWNIYKRRRLERDREDRRWVSAKIADPIREKYLLDLMKDYSKILLESVISDEDGGEDSLEDGSFRSRTTLEICCKRLSSDSDEPADGNKDNNEGDNSSDCGDNVDYDNIGDVEMQRSKKNSTVETNSNSRKDNIEMQRSKSNFDEEEEESDEAENYDGSSNLSQCDDSCGCRRTIFVPLPGQTAIECQGDKDEPRNCDRDCDSATISMETTKTQRQCPSQHQQLRAYSEGCAICLNPFEVNQKVTWSSNKDCPHVFHHECLLEWFVTVGAKAWKKNPSRHSLGIHGDLETMQSPSMSLLKKEIYDFAILCPCCRQDFFVEGNRQLGKSGDSNDNDIDNDIDTSINTNDTSSMHSSGVENDEEDMEPV